MRRFGALLVIVLLAAAGCGGTLVPQPRTVGYEVPDLVNPMRGQYDNLGFGLFPQASEPNKGRPAWPGTRFTGVRLPWRALQPKDPRTVAADAPASERYDFSALDSLIAAAGAQGRQFGLRVTAFESCCEPVRSGQTVIAVPDWLRTVAGATVTRVVDGVTYVLPDWNNPVYLTEFIGLIAALGQRYDRDERLGVFEMSGYGDFSENHVAFARDTLQMPGPSPERSIAELGYFSQYRDQYITRASAQSLVDATLRAFRSTRIVSTMGNPAIAGMLLRDSPELPGLRRPVGVRSDALGALPVMPAWAENEWSQYVQAGDPLIALLADRYRTAPVITEWPPQLLSGGTELDYYRRGLLDVVNSHVSMVSSTGFPAQSRPEVMTDEQYELWRRATTYSGYRYSVTGAAVIDDGAGLRAEVHWANQGSAPTYDQWKVRYEVVTESGDRVAQVDGAPPLRDLFSTLPYSDIGVAPAAALATETVRLPALRPGRYMLRVIVGWDEHKPDAVNPMDMGPMELAMQGRGTDGGYSAAWFEVR
ncbi:hypothetical protein GCM10027289_24350 [Tsukamurella serpentis]